MEDKICLSFCLCVLSTSVFLLALCHFTLKKRGTKKKIGLPLLSHNISKTSSEHRFLHDRVCSFRTCGAPLTIPAKSYSCGCCQQATEDYVQATPRASRWLSLWETPGSSSSPVAIRMCFGVCVPLLTSRTVWSRTYQRWTKWDTSFQCLPAHKLTRPSLE